MTEWISVGDRLPREMIDIILVCRNKGNKSTMPARYIDGKFIALTGFETISDRVQYANATHWMPLPEPPQ